MKHCKNHAKPSGSASTIQTAWRNQIKIGVKVEYPYYKTLHKGKKNKIKFSE